ncbi:MAG TPA: amidohydrolase [Pirellulales bacterium]|nr:amidohydrolase [Pirellulales bacterium]
MRFISIACLTFVVISPLAVSRASALEPDLILHHGKIVTVDKNFSIHEAIAIVDGKILAVGADDDILKLKGPRTESLDLEGRMLMPGLIDSHTHPANASMHEFDHEIPPMESISDVLDYVRRRAATLGPGVWIQVNQVFITRLKEQRYPTRAELDEAAPDNPVVFSTGPDASVNSLALKESGIDKDFKPSTPGGLIERDAEGNPTGILRSASQFLKAKYPKTKATTEQKDDRLAMLMADYNSLGITGIVDRHCSDVGIEQYRRMLAADRLTVRVGISASLSNSISLDKLADRVQQIAHDPLATGSPRLRIIGVKTFLDGGMLTGSAYMREPWGVSRIYSIDDPRYRGILYIEHDRLVAMVRAAVENHLQFTAHSVGDGAVHALLDAYEEVNRGMPIAATRPCITHSNFMSNEAIEQAARLGVCMDIQPAWLWLDGKTLLAQFGNDRLRWFQPLKTIFASGAIVGGGSDHMQKIGRRRSVNTYDPFLAMWVAMKRMPRGMDVPLHPEEALSRQQALRFSTANNAWIMFLDDKVGTLEPGKLADMIVVDRDLLECPLDDVQDAQVLRTYVEGKLVYKREIE